MIELTTVLLGLASGVTYSLTAFAKKEGQAFSWLKFGTTLGLGILAGVGIQVFNVDVGAAYNYLIMIGATGVVENVLKTGWRKLIKPLFVKLKLIDDTETKD